MKKIIAAAILAALPVLAQDAPKAPEAAPQPPTKMECPMVKMFPARPDHCPKGDKMGHPGKPGHPGAHAFMKGYEAGFERGFEAGLRAARKMHHHGPKGMCPGKPGMKPGCPVPPAPAAPASAPASEAPASAPEAAPAQA